MNLAQSTISERVRRMENQGLIKGYRGPSSMPVSSAWDVKAFISIRLAQHEKAVIHRFEEKIRDIANVQACYHLTGRYDYLLHVVAKDLDELGRLVKNVIAELPGYVTSETFVIFSGDQVRHGIADRTGEHPNGWINRIDNHTRLNHRQEHHAP